MALVRRGPGLSDSRLAGGHADFASAWLLAPLASLSHASEHVRLGGPGSARHLARIDADRPGQARSRICRLAASSTVVGSIRRACAFYRCGHRLAVCGRGGTDLTG